MDSLCLVIQKGSSKASALVVLSHIGKASLHSCLLEDANIGHTASSKPRLCNSSVHTGILSLVLCAEYDLDEHISLGRLYHFEKLSHDTRKLGHLNQITDKGRLIRRDSQKFGI